MKSTIFILKNTCRRCPYNDFKRCNVDFCVRAKCIYDSQQKGEKKGEKERQSQIDS